MVDGSEALNDLELATALKRKEPYALEVLVERHHDDLYRFMRHLTQRKEDAEDLTQQSLIRAYKKIGSFRGESSLKTWLHQVAFREFTTWRRRRQILVPLRLLKGAEDPGYQQVDDRDALLNKLHALPAELRQAVLLHYVQQLSIEEVAQVTRSPVGTVKSRLHHARRRLALSEAPPQENICYEF